MMHVVSSLLVGALGAGESAAADPMLIAASAEHVREVLADSPDRDYLVFPEDREHPIRRREVIPVRWVERDPGERGRFAGRGQPGEFFTFQLGVFAARRDVTDVKLDYTDLKRADGASIAGSSLNCFNLGGVDWRGRRFTKQVSVARGEVQALWIGVPIPADAAGEYAGTITVRSRDAEPTTVTIVLSVAGPVLEDHGDGEPWRHARLRWLDSTIGLDDEVTAPYTPVEVRGHTVGCLGRQVALDDVGLPAAIRSRFASTVDRLIEPGREILAEPMRFVVEGDSGPVEWAGEGVTFGKRTEGSVAWRSRATGGAFNLLTEGTLAYDGHLDYRLTLEARRDVQVKDVRLEIPFRRAAAKYLMGLGRKGGVRPKELAWKWNADVHQDSVWIGDVNAGLKCRLRGPDYQRPLVNIYYKYGRLNLPAAWHNEGRGGCRVDEVGDDRVLLRATSGPRSLPAGAKLRFDFDLLVTPLKPINPANHWTNRYYHTPALEAAVAKGANVLNVHHGNDLNPYINYPFHVDTVEALSRFVADGHDKGLKVKIYYTVRELTNHMVELWALRSLGNEIFADGPGNDARTLNNPKGPGPWLREHFRSHYVPAWRHVFRGGKHDGEVDASLVTTSMSRWHNYYLEGLAWLADHVEIDGLYIDDTAYDRTVMQRVRKILDRRRPEPLIDLHSWNHFNEHAGYVNCSLLYMELFPYIDSLWFGEAFDYDETPDYWLIEISGIPFGLMGEMLQGGGNPWRGLVYGMTNRLPWSGGDTSRIWKVWDAFGIEEARLVGYWSPDCPVRTDHAQVLATVYQRPGKSLVALASWAADPVRCRLQIDWGKLGIDPAEATLVAPEIPELQAAAEFRPDQELLIPPGRGRLLVMQPKRN